MLTSGTGVSVGCASNVSGVAAAEVVGVGAVTGGLVASGSSLAHARATANIVVAKTAIIGLNVPVLYNFISPLPVYGVVGWQVVITNRTSCRWPPLVKMLLEQITSDTKG